MNPADMILWPIAPSVFALVALHATKAWSVYVRSREKGFYTTPKAYAAIERGYEIARGVHAAASAPDPFRAHEYDPLSWKITVVSWLFLFAGIVSELAWLSWMGLAIWPSAIVPTLAELRITASASRAALRRGREERLLAPRDYTDFKAVVIAVAIDDVATSLYWIAVPAHAVLQLVASAVATLLPLLFLGVLCLLGFSKTPVDTLLAPVRSVMRRVHLTLCDAEPD